MEKSKGTIRDILTELEPAVETALKTYSNVERGSGHYSKITTDLLEKARDILLDYLKLNASEYAVIFCSPHRAETLKTQLNPNRYQVLSSSELGLPLGLRVLVVKKDALPEGVPFQTGGGMVKLVSPNSVVFADAPERFEAGTPAVLNIITLARSLNLVDHFGAQRFRKTVQKFSVAEILYQDDFQEYTGRELLIKLRKTMPDQDVLVPTIRGQRRYTNLDNAASTPAFLPVWQAARKTWNQPEEIQQEIVAEVKNICAGFLEAPQIVYTHIFCSNTTEAINLAAQNLIRSEVKETEPVILTTLLEHHSNELPWRYLPRCSLIRLPVNAEGFVNLAELENRLKVYNQQQKHGKKRIRLVAVSGASNVLGTFNDLRAIARIAHRYQAQILVDAAQLAAHRQISMIDDEIDYLAFSGHKMYAPFGTGVLVVRKEILGFPPDELEKIKVSGEENTTGIAALGKAILLLQRIGLDVIQSEEAALTRRALAGLAKIRGVKIFGMQNPGAEQFQNKGGIIVFRLNRVPHNLAAKELAERGGIGVRTGCFCAHLLVKQLMRINALRTSAADVIYKIFPNWRTDLLPGLIRISPGLENNEDDIDHFLKTLQEIVDSRRSVLNKAIACFFNGTPFLKKTETQLQIEAFGEAVMKAVFTETLQNQEETLE